MVALRGRGGEKKRVHVHGGRGPLSRERGLATLGRDRAGYNLMAVSRSLTLLLDTRRPMVRL
jgi:hypothetical protein